MIVHRNLTLSENLLSFAHPFEKQADLGMTITAEGVRTLRDMLRLMATQAQQLANTNQALIDEISEEARLPSTVMTFSVPLETKAPAPLRLEWIVSQIAECAAAMEKPNADIRQIASWLRYVGAHAHMVGDQLDVPQPARRPGWFRGMFEGGRA